MAMPWLGDALLPFEQRHASDKWRRIRRIRDPWRYTRPELIEIRAIQLTPGLLREHLDVMFFWYYDVQYSMLKPLEELDAEAAPLARQNYERATAEDGEALLRCILEHKPKYNRYMPLYVTRYLQQRRAQGADAPLLAAEFKTTSDRIQRWWKADVFDPLTGMPRDPDTISRGKPIYKKHRILGV